MSLVEIKNNVFKKELKHSGATTLSATVSVQSIEGVSCKERFRIVLQTYVVARVHWKQIAGMMLEMHWK